MLFHLFPPVKHLHLSRLIALGVMLLIFSACSKEEDQAMPSSPTTPSTSINKIMPLGASRVEGARPHYESFRYELWKLLVDGNWTFDYIGTVDDNGAYPSHSNQGFDQDHEGRGGWTSGDILAGLTNWVKQTGAPDIVLFSSPGGNDALQNLPYSQAISNINAIIDTLQAANPNVTILIEQMAPGKSSIMTGNLSNYFNQMQQDVLTIASQQTTATSKVMAIDMYSGFSDALLADDVHYNEDGARFIANRYYQVLQNELQP